MPKQFNRSYQHVIKFGFNPYRKNIKKNNFNASLSPYWQKQLDDMFASWN